MSNWKFIKKKGTRNSIKTSPLSAMFCRTCTAQSKLSNSLWSEQKSPTTAFQNPSQNSRCFFLIPIPIRIPVSSFHSGASCHLSLILRINVGFGFRFWWHVVVCSSWFHCSVWDLRKWKLDWFSCRLVSLFFLFWLFVWLWWKRQCGLWWTWQTALLWRILETLLKVFFLWIVSCLWVFIVCFVDNAWGTWLHWIWFFCFFFSLKGFMSNDFSIGSPEFWILKWMFFKLVEN